MSAHLSGASMRQYRSFLAGADAPKEDSDTNTSEVVASIAKVLLDESAIKDVEVLKAKAANAKVLRDRCWNECSTSHREWFGRSDIRFSEQ
jgi:hypothetical protein